VPGQNDDAGARNLGIWSKSVAGTTSALYMLPRLVLNYNEEQSGDEEKYDHGQCELEHR
jgi:hypothetical protein